MKIMSYCVALSAAVLFVLPASAQINFAHPLAYEGFDYADGTDFEDGSGTGGIGWENAWTKNGGNGGVGRSTVQAGGLGYTDADGNVLYVTGNHGLSDYNGVQNPDGEQSGGNTQYWRNINLGGQTLDEFVGVGNSYYMSFIGERQGVSNTDTFLPGDPNYVNPHAPNEFSRNAHLSLTTGAGGEDGQLGNPSNQTTDTWKIRAKDEPDGDSGVQFSFNQSFIVAKVTVGDGTNTTDVIEMWIDPLLTSEALAGTPDATHLVFDGGDAYNLAQRGIGMYVGSQGGGRAGGVMTFDEIRVGTSWLSVTPHNIPEPSTFVLLCLGGVALVAARRRFQK